MKSKYIQNLPATNGQELLLNGRKGSWSPESMKQLTLSDFPVIEDFRIELNSTFFVHQAGSREHTSVDFTAREHRILIRTMFMDRYVQSETSIPTGTLEQPYMDMDQGYELVMFVEKGFVHLLKADWDANPNLYTQWFKVPLDIYATAWLNIKKWYTIRMNNTLDIS